MEKFDTVVVGGGAAGIVAAISAKRKGDTVVICEKMPKLGKKILASGGGRCNLLNEKLDSSYYNKSSQGLVASVFSRFSKDDILKFFRELGLEVCSDGDRIFPVTNQASSVLKVLEIALRRLSIPIEFNFDVSGILTAQNGSIVTSKTGKKIICDKVIIAGGGKSYPALGSDGSCYELAKRLGHRIITPIPVAVPLVVKDPLCHALQGQKITASAKAVIDGKTLCEAGGEVLFTQYGLSGTAVLDISGQISAALNRDKMKNALVSVDLVPSMDRKALQKELSDRMARDLVPEEILVGILPNKVAASFQDIVRCSDIEAIATILKDRVFKVVGTRGWNEAEFTAGGVDVTEVKESTLESKVKKGLYFAGEVLDIDGKRGGYNFAWAWASGFIAGLTQ